MSLPFVFLIILAKILYLILISIIQPQANVNVNKGFIEILKYYGIIFIYL
mgnify:CR=1 FL=1